MIFLENIRARACARVCFDGMTPMSVISQSRTDISGNLILIRSFWLSKKQD